MERVVVSVRHRDGVFSRDLAVPAAVAAAELAPLLAGAVTQGSAAPPGDARLEVVALGRLLEPHETLVDVGAWDGSEIVVHAAGAPAAQEERARPVDSGREQKKQGFSWKRLDD